MDQMGARDYLLPGVWKRHDANGQQLDLVCNDIGGIDLQVDRKRHQLLTSAEIAAGKWGAFNPRIVKILSEETI